MANSASLRGGEKNVQDWINLICGALLFVSPWALGFSGDLMAARTAWVGGVIIFVMGVAALVQFVEWEEWVALIVGALVIIAPWILRFRDGSRGDVVMRRAWRHCRAVVDFRDLGRPSSRSDSGAVRSARSGGSLAKLAIRSNSKRVTGSRVRELALAARLGWAPPPRRSAQPAATLTPSRWSLLRKGATVIRPILERTRSADNRRQNSARALHRCLPDRAQCACGQTRPEGRAPGTPRSAP